MFCLVCHFEIAPCLSFALRNEISKLVEMAQFKHGLDRSRVGGARVKFHCFFPIPFHTPSRAEGECSFVELLGRLRHVDGFLNGNRFSLGLTVQLHERVGHWLEGVVRAGLNEIAKVAAALGLVGPLQQSITA